MAFLMQNPNPKSARVGDCVVRAISIATGKDWDSVYALLAVKGYEMCDMPSSNAVWARCLEDEGFDRHIISSCCFSIRDFCLDHPKGTYVLGTGSHAVAVIDGNYIDAWDSGNEVPIYYFERRR